MCNPALIGLALMAAGSGATAIGQRQGAKAARREARNEEDYQQGLRTKSLKAAGEVVDQADPKQLAADIAAPQAVVDASQVSAAEIAKVAQASDGAAQDGQVYDAAVGDAGRAVRPMATRLGLAQGLENKDSALGKLAHENVFLGEDSRRSLATFANRLARAGRKGHGLRTVGKLANIAGGAMTGGALWGPALAAGTEVGSQQRMQDGKRERPQDR